MRTSNVLFVLVAILGCTTLSAQDKSNDTTARYFIIQASIGNLQEVAMGRLAAAQAVDPNVKAFGQRMVSDHTGIQTRLMQLIKSKDFRIPSEATDPIREVCAHRNRSRRKSFCTANAANPERAFGSDYCHR